MSLGLLGESHLMTEDEQLDARTGQAEDQRRDPNSDHPAGNGRDAKSPSGASLAARHADKIRCLDGLRGIACLLVFNYHFLWPWTGSIMLGYGALPPRAPEPYTGLHTLPILCLLHRGRPMVAIFFAISGYVVCRHILRAIHERRVQDAYQKLASAVFRRAFRLYIPPTISMFLVAILAQVGVFKSEDAIFKGPDSKYINGTLTVGKMPYGWDSRCSKGTTPVLGVYGISKYMRLESPDFLNITIPVTTPTVCMNSTSYLVGPDKTYKIYEEWLELWEVEANSTSSATSTGTSSSTLTKSTSRARSLKSTESIDSTGKTDSVRGTGSTGKTDSVRGVDSSSSDDDNFLTGRSSSSSSSSKKKKKKKGPDMKWVQYGGSWEEHPLIHDNITYAAQNFTRVYAEWANPFNFGHYHTRYDPHTFTIPKEFRGSVVCYVFLLATAAMKIKWRFRIGAGLAVYSLLMGYWDMAVFLGATLMSERDIREADGRLVHDRRAPSASYSQYQLSPQSRTWLRRFGVFVGLYFLSYPDAGAEWTPGFVILSYFVPRYYSALSGWMFYQGIGALILIPSILHGNAIREWLESPFPQWMGKLSFSFYLVHGPVLHSLGFWIMPRLFEAFGMAWGFAVGYVILMGISLYLSVWWYEKVDVWSMTIGRRVEAMAVDRS